MVCENRQVVVYALQGGRRTGVSCNRSCICARVVDRKQEEFIIYEQQINQIQDHRNHDHKSAEKVRVTAAREEKIAMELNTTPAVAALAAEVPEADAAGVPAVLLPVALDTMEVTSFEAVVATP